MRWILLDVALAVLVLVLLALVALSLWHRVKALGAAVGVAGAQLAAVGAQLDGLTDRDPAFRRPTPSGHVAQPTTTPPGVRSNPSS